MASFFKSTRRVEFYETDMAGIVHFSNFYKWMEQCEHEFFRSLGLSIVRNQPDGSTIGWPRVSSQCRFESPATDTAVFGRALNLFDSTPTADQESIRGRLAMSSWIHMDKVNCHGNEEGRFKKCGPEVGESIGIREDSGRKESPCLCGAQGRKKEIYGRAKRCDQESGHERHRADDRFTGRNLQRVGISLPGRYKVDGGFSGRTSLGEMSNGKKGRRQTLRYSDA